MRDMSIMVKKNKGVNWSRVAHYVMLGCFIFFVLAPFYVLLVTSIMNKYEGTSTNFKFWPRQGIDWEWYEQLLFGEVLPGHSLWNGFKNTFVYYLPSSLVGVLVSAMSAFAFAKMQFKAKDMMFSILMGTMMIPNTMALIINVLIFDTLGWMGTPLPLIIPRMFGTISVVFFLRQYYMGMPEDLIGCAKIDGLGYFGIFTRIMLPVSVPVLAAQFILYFIGGYNDYMGPLLYLQDGEQETLQIVLAQFENIKPSNWPLRMAGCVISMVPMIALYLASQKLILMDLSIGSGFKG